MEKPHAPACDRNQDVIPAVLRDHFMDRHQLPEIGSGQAVDAHARGIGLELIEDREMPANNRCLVWQRRSPQTRL